MARTPCLLLLFGLMLAVLTTGCRSPYHSDQGALTGGLLGAGTGAVVGHALGNTAGGALLGAGVGALSGAAIGNGMDEVEANNRAMIAQQLGRQVAPGAVTSSDVIAMIKAGVHEDLVVNHVRAHGMAVPLQANDLIYLQQQGISPRVVAAMQESPPRQVQPVVVEQPAPRAVIIQEYPYRPYCGPHYYPHAYYRWH